MIDDRDLYISGNFISSLHTDDGHNDAVSNGRVNSTSRHIDLLITAWRNG